MHKSENLSILSELRQGINNFLNPSNENGQNKNRFKKRQTNVGNSVKQMEHHLLLIGG